MVPDAEFASYYGQPIVKAPVWKSREIAGYLFFGGLAGGASLLATAGERRGANDLAIRMKVVALGSIGLGGAALVKDLGRPTRFLNMLRVFKPTSPMSVGSWLLAAYGPATAVAAASSVTGRAPRLGTTATVVTAVLGSTVATYTAALISDTAVPAWHDGHREMPFVFAGSSASAAGGIGLIVAPTSQSGIAHRFAVGGVLLEIVAMHRMTTRMGFVGEPYGRGAAGGTLKVAEVLAIGGSILSIAGRRSRVMSATAGGALVVASALTRTGIFAAGLQSAADPRYVVEPQRRRLAARADSSRSGAGASGE